MSGATQWQPRDRAALMERVREVIERTRAVIEHSRATLNQSGDALAGVDEPARERRGTPAE